MLGNPLRYDHCSARAVAISTSFPGPVDVSFCFCFLGKFLLRPVDTLFSQYAWHSRGVVQASHREHAVSFSRTFGLSLLTSSRSYLIGSGGTLMFDVFIVAQSFIYRPHPRARESRLFPREVTAAEEESLMRSDGVEESYTPRRRFPHLPVTAEEADVMD